MGPRADIPSPHARERTRRERALANDILEKMARRFPHLRRRLGPGESGEAVPVEPNRPSHLSGGAAAALELDD